MKKTYSIQEPKDWFQVKQDYELAEKMFREKHDITKISVKRTQHYQEVLDKLALTQRRRVDNLAFYKVYLLLNYNLGKDFYAIKKARQSYTHNVHSVMKSFYNGNYSASLVKHWGFLQNFVKAMKEANIYPYPKTDIKRAKDFIETLDTAQQEFFKDILVEPLDEKNKESLKSIKDLTDKSSRDTFECKEKEVKTEACDYVVMLENVIKYNTSNIEAAKVYAQALKDLDLNVKILQITEVSL